MHYPTLELRVCDSCVRMEDSVAIAALYGCVVRMLDRRHDIHAGSTGASRSIASENFWRVQRDGVRASLLDEQECAAIPLASQMEALIRLVEEDAAALGCERDVQAVLDRVSAGTGADRQVEVYQRGLQNDLDNEAALRGVVDWLAASSARSE